MRRTPLTTTPRRQSLLTLEAVHSARTQLNWPELNSNSRTSVWSARYRLTAALEYTGLLVFRTIQAPIFLVSMQPIKSRRWRAWPMNAPWLTPANWVELLQVSSSHSSFSSVYFVQYWEHSLSVCNMRAMKVKGQGALGVIVPGFNFWPYIGFRTRRCNVM